MAFYFNRGNRSDEQAVTRQPEKIQLQNAPQRPAPSTVSGSGAPLSDSNADTKAARPSKRERLGETLRFTRTERPANTLRDIRLAKIFGEPVLDSSTHVRWQSKEALLQPRDVLFNSSGRISYGTFRGLTIYLTQAHQHTENFSKTFFLTFRSFSTPRDLAEALVTRMREIPEGAERLTNAETRVWREKVQIPVQHKCFQAIKLWYDKYWLIEADGPVLPYLCAFLIKEYLPVRHGSAAKECLRFLQLVEATTGCIDLRHMRNEAGTLVGLSSPNILSSAEQELGMIDDGVLEEASRSDTSADRLDRRNRLSGRTYTDAPSDDCHSTESTSTSNRSSHSEWSALHHSQQHHKGRKRRGFFGRFFHRSAPATPAEDDGERHRGTSLGTPGGSSNSEDPDITDLLMATVGMDLSFEAYRRTPHILHVNPLDVACQLTIIESSCFCQIQPFELLNKEFSRKPSSKAPNVLQMSRWNTQITRWASLLILSEHTPERRCRVLRYFIQLGTQLLALKNYDAVMAIKGAIYCAAVMRLKRTWSLLPKKFDIMCRRLLDAMDPDHNYANYRALLRKSQPPLLPFLGLYLTDLTFLEDGNPTYRRYEQLADDNGDSTDGGVGSSAAPGSRRSETTESSNTNECLNRDQQSQQQQENTADEHPVRLTGQTCALFAHRQDIDLSNPSILVNFEKSYKLASIIQEIQKFQVEYSGNFTMAIPGLQQYLIEQWSKFEGYDDDKVYELSLKREPRAVEATRSLSIVGNDDRCGNRQSVQGAKRLTRLLPGAQRLRGKDRSSQARSSISPRLGASSAGSEESDNSLF